MPLDFRPQPHGRSAGRARAARTLPRTTQRRLLMLSGLLALVLLAMYEARKPANWRWLWALQQVADPNAAGQRTPDTRLPPADSGESATQWEPIVRGPGNGVPASEDVQSPLAPPRPSQAARDLRQLAAVDAWTRLLQELNEDQRQTLLRGLHAARDQQPLRPEDRQAWPSSLERVDQGWADYLARAAQAIEQPDSGLTEQEKRDWSGILAQVEVQYRSQFRPELASLAEVPAGDRPPTAETDAEQGLATLQQLIDRVLLKNITDNTVFRSAEKDIWFRLLDDLSRREPAELRDASLGQVSFVQLYEQPGEYRGQLVTVSGRAEMAYYRPAPENFYGIPGYYVFWLRPVGVNSPIVVYSLDVPPGFPDVRSGVADGRSPGLEEDLEFTGYFFKRWAYPAQDGTRLAPLLLAKTPAWQPRPAALAATGALPGALFWTLLVAGTGLFAITFAGCVYWFSRRSARPRRRAAAPPYPRAEAPP